MVAPPQNSRTLPHETLDFYAVNKNHKQYYVPVSPPLLLTQTLVLNFLFNCGFHMWTVFIGHSFYTSGRWSL